MTRLTEANAAEGVEPRLMREMIHALDIDGLVQGEFRAEAADLCDQCKDRHACREWLDGTALRGAEHAPDFCLNKDRFEALSTEVPTGF
ncbi:DUF6455 family protein [Mongoliimonas terrestris]|uniref:DUF6455 family protein n=1 Tax=Mongoliimonas terrestris TaxID=1709001 RepID=UPI000A605704|nr:DUF6455 family protein [Mongoliimonas terrestris]